MTSRLLVAPTLLLFIAGTFQAHYFTLPGSRFFYALTTIHQVVDVNGAGNVAVALTNDDATGQLALVTSFEPTTGNPLDSELAGFGPAHLQISKSAGGDRVVVLTTEGGPNTVTIYDLSPVGIMVQRARTRLTETVVDFRSNLVLSSLSRIGFVLVHNANVTAGRELITFSLDDGAILGRLSVGFAAEFLSLKEANGQRTLAFFRLFSPGTSLVLVDATNPTQPIEVGNISLPMNPQPVGGITGGIEFSSNSRFLFAIDPFGSFNVVDVVNKVVVVTLEGSFRARVRIFENLTKRILAVERNNLDSQAQPVSLLLLDAINPAIPTVIASMAIPVIVYGRTDFVFGASGNLLAMATDEGFKVLSIPSLQTAFAAPIPNPQEGFTHELKVFGQPGRALGAWGIFTVLFGSFSLPEIPSFDICIQDDSSGNVLRMNSSTGEYEFTNCSGFSIAGIGSLITKGGIITLQDYAADRRVLARIDTEATKGTASIQVFSPRNAFTISDRNTSNNSCACNTL